MIPVAEVKEIHLRDMLKLAAAHPASVSIGRMLSKAVQDSCTKTANEALSLALLGNPQANLPEPVIDQTLQYLKGATC